MCFDSFKNPISKSAYLHRDKCVFSSVLHPLYQQLIMPKQKTITRGKLVSKLDNVFSKFIRQRGSRSDIAQCFTCGKYDHWKKMQCGHFRSRQAYSTRWDEINCQVQCVGCNMFKQGEQYLFAVNLDQKYGEGTATKLYYKSIKLTKYSMIDLREKLEYYQQKIL